MSRYLLLLIFTLPFILAGILGAITQYKLGHSSKRRSITQIIVWMCILAGLALAQTIYTSLFSHGLTATESLSLFDVVQITAIVILFYIVNRMRLKLETVDKRLRDLHQELSIQLSDHKK